MIQLFKFNIVILALFSFNLNAQNLNITNLKAESGKTYLIKNNGFNSDSLQYIDRDYTFDRIPEEMKGKTLIMLAGNDKMFEENEKCFSFHVNKSVFVHVLYSDKFPVLPVWLLDYTKTDKKVYRKDASEVTMKGIFRVYSKEFPAGDIQINGCLGKGIKTEAFVNNGGSGYCMYSVVIEEVKKS
jgi:hypothetical protein